MANFLTKAIEKANALANQFYVRLTPVIEAGKAAYHQTFIAMKNLYQTLKSGLKTTEATFNVISEMLKAAGNAGKGLFLELPKAAVAKYRQQEENTSLALLDALKDFSAAEQNASEAAKSLVSTGKAGLELLENGGTTCVDAAKAAYNTGAFAVELGKLLCEGALMASSVAYDAASTAYSYTPSYEAVKSKMPAAFTTHTRPLGNDLMEVEMADIVSIAKAAAAA